MTTTDKAMVTDAWQAHDLIRGRSYESIYFGTVTYIGVDNYHGDKTHEFEVGRNQRRYWKTEKLGEFLKPKPSPVPNNALLVEAAHQALGSLKALGAERGYASQALRESLGLSTLSERGEEEERNTAPHHLTATADSQDPLSSEDGGFRQATPAPQSHLGLPIELNGISDALEYGKGIWSTCTGCHESNEGYPTGPYSTVMKCHLGGGCFECGGIGAVWDTTDYENMGNFLAADIGEPETDWKAWATELEKYLKSKGDDAYPSIIPHMPKFSPSPSTNVVGWNYDMSAAPKDRRILGLCRHDADQYHDASTGRLTDYGCWAEAVGRVEDGPHVLEWGGEDSDHDEWSGRTLTWPNWWFRFGSEFETVANPIAWMPIPADHPSPETKSTTEPCGYVIGGCTYLEVGSPLLTEAIKNSSVPVYPSPSPRERGTSSPTPSPEGGR